VRVCDPEIDTCDISCSNSVRRRRAIDDNIAAIKIGPISVLNN